MPHKRKSKRNPKRKKRNPKRKKKSPKRKLKRKKRSPKRNKMGQQWGRLGDIRAQMQNKLNKQSVIALAQPIKPKLNSRAKEWYPKGLNIRANEFSLKSQNYVLSAHGGYLPKNRLRLPANVKIIFYTQKGNTCGIWNNEIQTRICKNPNKKSYIYSRGRYIDRKEEATNKWIQDYYFASDRVYFTKYGETTHDILKNMHISYLHFLDLNPQYIKKIKLTTRWKANIRLNKIYSNQFYTTKKKEILANILNKKNLSVNKFCKLNYHNPKQIKARIKKFGADNIEINKGTLLHVSIKNVFYSGLVKCSDNRVVYNIDTMGPISLSQLLSRIWKPDKKFIIHAVVCRSRIN